MQYWHIKKENNVYQFSTLNGNSTEGICSIAIYIKPEHKYSEIYAKTYNKTAYIDLLNIAKMHAPEKNALSHQGIQKAYCFDGCDDKDDAVENTLSNQCLRMSYLDSFLCCINPFKDKVSGVKNIEDTLNMLAKVDHNIHEIIEFMHGKIAVQSLKDQCSKLIRKCSLFSQEAQDKKYNINVLPAELRKTILSRKP